MLPEKYGIIMSAIFINKNLFVFVFLKNRAFNEVVNRGGNNDEIETGLFSVNFFKFIYIHLKQIPGG